MKIRLGDALVSIRGRDLAYAVSYSNSNRSQIDLVKFLVYMNPDNYGFYQKLMKALNGEKFKRRFD